MKALPESNSQLLFQLDEFYTQLSKDGRSIEFLSKEEIRERPFPGLRPYKASEFKLFKGRDPQSQDLIDRLKTNHFLAVIGSSGTGKSSLVRAGLIPQLFGGYLYNAGTNWDVTICRPGKDPIENLAYALARTKSRSPEDTVIMKEFDLIYPLLNRSTYGILDVNELLNPPELPEAEKSNLLIVIDQFEELFRFKRDDLGKPDLETHFVNLLISASSAADTSIYIMITMRSEFLGDCVKYRGLPEAINKGQYLVPQLTREQLKKVIEDPISLAGKKIAPGLVELLVNEIEASKAKNDLDQLPILQHALMRTFQEAKNDDEITYEHYKAAGEMEMALANHAESKFSELAEEKNNISSEGEEEFFSFRQKITRLIFQALTDASTDKKAGRRPTELKNIYSMASSLGATEEQVDEVVDHFRDTETSFIMPPINIPLGPNVIMDISHESLMRGWKGLVKWADQEAQNGEAYLRLANAAERAKNIKLVSDEDSFLVDPELKITLDWKEKNNPTAKWAEGYKGDFKQAMEFLEDSRKKDVADKEEKKKLAREKMNAEKAEARKKYVYWIIALMAVLLIGAIGSTIRFISISKQAKANADSAVKQKNIAEKQKRRSDILKIEADSLRAIADSNTTKAIDSAVVAKTQRGIADSLNKVATKEKNNAQDSAKVAATQRDIAKQQEKDATNQGYKTAPSEYARLIREGPTTKMEIQKDSFDNKLVAYCMHLDSLKNLIKGTGDEKEKEKYNNLKDRLYYNNDLYEKIYACFETAPLSARDPVFARVTGNIYEANFNKGLDKRSLIVKIAAKKQDTNIIAFLEDKGDRLIICSTNDNWINVYDRNTLALKNEIPMGAKVTALSYDHESNIIYFGLESGDIGYIKYNKDKKNQPVFENALGSEITAIQFFKYQTLDGVSSFLLAAARKSKVVVYKLGKEEPFPDKKLLGNSLPEKKLIDITDAFFDEKLKKVAILVKSPKTNNETIYSWNPFSFSVLEEYKKYKTVNAAFLNRKPDIKIY